MHQDIHQDICLGNDLAFLWTESKANGDKVTIRVGGWISYEPFSILLSPYTTSTSDEKYLTLSFLSAAFFPPPSFESSLFETHFGQSSRAVVTCVPCPAT